MLAGMKGHPVVVNVWATWCDPCREEFPELVRFHREIGPRGIRVAGISLDAATALNDGVIPFLIAQGADFDQYIKTPGGDEEFINAIDTAWSGALPATFVYDREGRLIKSIYGSTTFEQLEAIAAPLLEPSK